MSRPASSNLSDHSIDHSEDGVVSLASADLSDENPEILLAQHAEPIHPLDARCLSNNLTSALPNSKHSRFFFSDGSVSFTVEGVSYCVHESLLSMHARGLLEKLDLKPEPIALENVSVAEMDAFMAILYPSDIRRRDISSIEEWSYVLRLSTRWGISSFRSLAIDKLDNIASPADRLVLARECEVDDWVVPSLTSLCLRPEPLDFEEMERMSLRDVFFICNTRELVLSGKIVATAADVSTHLHASLHPPTSTPRSSLGEIELPEATPMGTSSHSFTPESIHARDRHQPENLSPGGSCSSSKMLIKIDVHCTISEHLSTSLSLEEALHGNHRACVIKSITKDNAAHTIPIVTDHICLSAEPISCLPIIYSALQRGADDGYFIPFAVRLLCGVRGYLPRHIYPRFWPGLDDIFANLLQRSPNVELTSLASTILYGTSSPTMSKEDYVRRGHNIDSIIKNLIVEDVLDPVFVCESLPLDAAKFSLEDLRDRLAVLGSVLSSKGGERLNSIVLQRLLATERHTLTESNINAFRDLKQKWVSPFSRSVLSNMYTL